MTRNQIRVALDEIETRNTPVAATLDPNFPWEKAMLLAFLFAGKYPQMPTN